MKKEDGGSTDEKFEKAVKKNCRPQICLLLLKLQFVFLPFVLNICTCFIKIEKDE